MFPWVLLTCSSISSSPCTPEIRSRGLEVEVKVTQSCPTLWDPMDWPWNSPGQNTGVGSLFLLQGIFPTQGSNPGLPHYRRIVYQLSHKESPRILEWVAYPFSRGSPNPGIELGSPALQVDSLPTELSGKTLMLINQLGILLKCRF